MDPSFQFPMLEHILKSNWYIVAGIIYCPSPHKNLLSPLPTASISEKAGSSPNTRPKEYTTLGVSRQWGSLSHPVRFRHVQVMQG